MKGVSSTPRAFLVRASRCSSRAFEHSLSRLQTEPGLKIHSFHFAFVFPATAKMPTKSHHRSRSSVDHVLELLAVLPEDDIAHLLDDFNHTTSSNVPVSEAIALFDPSKPKPKRLFRASSPVRRLEAELVRRNSKRISSAPEPTLRPKTASSPPASTATIVAPPSPPPSTSAAEPVTTTEPEPFFFDRPSRPSLTLSPPNSFERPQTADASSPETRAWSYKRISRPLILSPTAKAELHELLLAYLSDGADSATSTTTSSPITPNTASVLSPFRFIQSERDTPGIDLLEPSPTRAPRFGFGRGGKNPADNMSGIFEILASH
ncbi:hypothetical protein B0T16DRAFT_406431 [Cercophora newfieldiana]|uniref:Uncharacterized protein n=1 Tax=Cercophora newfieldiana TaxID=92897 RepID=A0AA40CVW0_9PEZI|nr:hypothetical protein B0T16DRAFT_406431 [Cercophora newfieldiana]